MPLYVSANILKNPRLAPVPLPSQPQGELVRRLKPGDYLHAMQPLVRSGTDKRQRCGDDGRPQHGASG